MKKRKLAIFDIDGTIFRSSLFLELTYELVRQGTFPKTLLDEVEEDYALWLNRKGDYRAYAYKLVEIFVSRIKGKSEKDFVKASKKVIRNHIEKVYRYTRDLIKDLKKENYFLLAVSGSPQYVVEEFTKYYNFDSYICTMFEAKRGILTGNRYKIEHQKGELIKNFVIENSSVTLKGSIGVGDTESDASFLEIVDTPIAFNPSMKLVEKAKKSSWRIVVERKDVIYDIVDFKIVR